MAGQRNTTNDIYSAVQERQVEHHFTDEMWKDEDPMVARYRGVHEALEHKGKLRGIERMLTAFGSDCTMLPCLMPRGPMTQA